MAYRVELAPRATRELRRLDHIIRERVLRALIGLEVEPRPQGVKKLVGAESTWRLRIGDYRIVYEIRDRELLVMVIRVAHRREVCR